MTKIGPPWWSKVWIVAGGPSAKSFDLSRAYGDVVLGVNDGALRRYRETGYVYGARANDKFTVAFATCDPDWIKEHRTYLSFLRGGTVTG